MSGSVRCRHWFDEADARIDEGDHAWASATAGMLGMHGGGSRYLGDEILASIASTTRHLGLSKAWRSASGINDRERRVSSISMDSSITQLLTSGPNDAFIYIAW
jgi:hypothetical protein